MIPQGHKITVLASSKTKSGANIRRGSIGFVSGIGKTYTFSKQGMFVTPAKIVFTRFGYEKKERNETKFVTLLHPITSPSYIKYHQKFLNTLTIRSVDMTDRLKKHFANEGVLTKPSATVVIKHINHGTNLLTNLNNLKAWSSSILQSGLLHPVVMSTKISNLNVAKNELIKDYPEFELKLKDCILFKKQSNTFIDTIANNDALKLLLIAKLQGFLTLKAREDILNYLNIETLHWAAEAKIFRALWYLLDNNITIPVNAKESIRVNSRLKIISEWLQIFKAIK